MRKAAVSRRKGTGIWPVPLVALSKATPNYMQNFLDTRKGAGASVFSDYGLSYIGNTVFVTTTADNGSNSSPTPGSLRAACKINGPVIIRFTPGLTGDILPPARQAIPLTSNTLIDGSGFTGTVKCGLNPGGGISNYAVIFLSIHEPFVYGTSPSNKQVMSFSNGKNGYMRWCTLWDGGDVLIASGAYNPQQQPAPYYYTVEECLLGPSPGEYAFMAPMRGAYVDQGPWQPNTAYPKLSMVTYNGLTWYSAGPMAASSTFDPKAGWVMPGMVNAIDNDARNGKILNSAVDHNYLDAHLDEAAAYSRACYSTIINNIMQGGTVRQPKSKGQVMDVVGNLFAKYGHPYRAYAGTSGSNVGGAVSCEDEALMNIEGNVWIPKTAGEQVFAMPWSRADELGVPRMTVDSDGAASNAISQEGLKQGNAYIAPNNWLPGGITKAQGLANGQIQPIASYDGYDRTANRTVNGSTISGYTLVIPSVSSYAGAAAQVQYLESNCGNPFATTKPNSWRLAHAGAAGNFPNL